MSAIGRKAGKLFKSGIRVKNRIIAVTLIKDFCNHFLPLITGLFCFFFTHIPVFPSPKNKLLPKGLKKITCSELVF